LLRVNPWALAP
jgi:hypothetical protein